MNIFIGFSSLNSDELSEGENVMLYLARCMLPKSKLLILLVLQNHRLDKFDEERPYNRRFFVLMKLVIQIILDMYQVFIFHYTTNNRMICYESIKIFRDPPYLSLSLSSKEPDEFSSSETFQSFREGVASRR